MLSDKRRAKIELLIKESNRLMGYPGGLPTGGRGGMPAYHKGGTVKKDGYLTDKKLKPYAKVQKGEKVVPTEGKISDKTPRSD